MCLGSYLSQKTWPQAKTKNAANKQMSVLVHSVRAPPPSHIAENGDLVEYTDEDLVRDRNTEMRRVLTQVTQVNEMMLDLNTLVLQQGDDIDHIESLVQASIVNTEKGVEALAVAESRQQADTGCVAKTTAGSFVAGAITVLALVVLL